MKSYSILLGLIVSCAFTSEANDIGILVNVDTNSFTDKNTQRLLQTRLESACVTAGMAATDDNALFLNAILTPVSENVFEGGMRKIKQSVFELSLTVENPILGVKFGTHSILLKGYSQTSNRSVIEAIKCLSPAEPSMIKFLKTTTDKADEYYEKHFDEILAKARTIAASGAYDEAIALLWGLPTSGVNSQRLFGEIEMLYNKIQISECGFLISNARSAFAKMDFSEAAEWLSAVDANSPCYSEAVLLNEKVTKAFAGEKMQEIKREEAERRFQAKMIENDKRRKHEFQQSIVKSVSNIATAYLNSRRNTILYVL